VLVCGAQCRFVFFFCYFVVGVATSVPAVCLRVWLPRSPDYGSASHVSQLLAIRRADSHKHGPHCAGGFIAPSPSYGSSFIINDMHWSMRYLPQHRLTTEIQPLLGRFCFETYRVASCCYRGKSARFCLLGIRTLNRWPWPFRN